MPLTMGWAIEAMCEHLEAVSKSQLNRLVMNVPPGMMKPVHVDELVLTDGGYKRLGDVAVGDRVLTHRGRFRAVTAVHEQGAIDTVIVRTFAGRAVRAAPDHPFLTPRGWIAAGELKPGDYAAVPHRVEPLQEGGMTAEEARLLGYLIGDGCISQRSLAFVNADQEVIDDFIACAKAVGFYAEVKAHPNRLVKAAKVILKSTETRWKDGHKGEPPVLTWLRAHGLYRSNSYTKRIPAAVFSGGETAMRNFLGAYWSCDGHISRRHAGAKTTMIASATTVSEGLASDLLRLGAAINIDFRVRRKGVKLKTKKQAGEIYTSFNVVTTQRNEVSKFADLPGLMSRKAAPAKQSFRDRFDPHFYEDEVISVGPAGQGECRCLTVEEDASFTANNLAVHNSLLTCVFWPAWEWGPLGRPSMRYMGASYERDLAIRDARKMRILVESDWFQERWPVKMAGDQNEKMKFENAHTGLRLARPATSLTGERVHRLILDDPHSVTTAESTVEREKTVQTFREAAQNRMVDPLNSAIIVIMQRLHEGDVSGWLLQNAKDIYEFLILPMRFEGDRRCSTSIGFVDPRTKEGELIFPERFPEEVVDRDEKIMGEYATAGQNQQRPAPREGGMFKADRIKVVKSIPPVSKWRRAWDLAGTEGAGAYTAGVLIGKLKDGSGYIVADVKRRQFSSGKVQTLIKSTAAADRTGKLAGAIDESTGKFIVDDGAPVLITGADVKIRVPQDPGQAGKAQKADYVKLLDGYTVKMNPTAGEGDKEARAEPFAVQVENDRVCMLEGPWNQDFVDELKLFPGGKFKDQVDAAADGYNDLIGDGKKDAVAVAPVTVDRASPYMGAARG